MASPGQRKFLTYSFRRDEYISILSPTVSNLYMYGRNCSGVTIWWEISMGNHKYLGCASRQFKILARFDLNQFNASNGQEPFITDRYSFRGNRFTCVPWNEFSSVERKTEEKPFRASSFNIYSLFQRRYDNVRPYPVPSILFLFS